MNASRFLAILAAGLALSAVVAEAVAPSAPAFVILAETATGHVFEAGSGGTCTDAMRHAVIPAGWQSIRCEAAS